MTTSTEYPPALVREVEKWERRKWYVERMDSRSATLALEERVPFLLNLILTLCTAGLWLIAWVIMGVSKGTRRMTITLDSRGKVRRRKA